MENLEEIKLSAIEELSHVEDGVQLNEVRNKYLSKKGIVSSLMSKMKDLSPEERAGFGKVVNDLKEAISVELDKKKVEIDAKELEAKLNKEKIDITLPGQGFQKGSKHPLQIVNDEMCRIFIGMGYEICEGPEVETETYNFKLLNIPEDHPAREMQDTFYIDVETLLRTHTSGVQARTMLSKNGVGPVKMVCPGKVYRKDDDDATHSHEFNQFEGLVIDENITMADLKGTLELFAKKMFGEDRKVKFRGSYFPFTEPSVEVDVSCGKCGGKGCSMCKGTGWIEVLGAGMVHPNVLNMCGFDATKYQGFAFGVGIDRVALLRYGIDDIRLLYSNDMRFLSQFRKDF